MKNSAICPFNDEWAIEFSLMSHIGIIWNSYAPPLLCYERVKQVLDLNREFSLARTGETAEEFLHLKNKLLWSWHVTVESLR